MMMDFHAGFQQAQQSQEPDVPPGAPPYVSGPLANPKPPTPTPAPQSLSDLAAGGFNHAQAWTAGQTAPPAAIEQKPFNSAGATVPATPAEDPMHRFTWSAGFGSAAQGY